MKLKLIWLQHFFDSWRSSVGYSWMKFSKIAGVESGMSEEKKKYLKYSYVPRFITFFCVFQRNIPCSASSISISKSTLLELIWESIAAKLWRIPVCRVGPCRAAWKDRFWHTPKMKFLRSAQSYNFYKQIAHRSHT